MSIGEVLAELRAEFPDTTISKLRFLEAEGLVEPQRTAAGYRKYTWDDVARLRFVLTAQRDQYLPLRVIREQLAAIDRGETPAGTPGAGRGARRPAAARRRSADPPTSGSRRAELLRPRRASPRRRWPSWSSTGLVARPPAAGTTRDARGGRRGGRRSWPSTAWSRGTCARTGPPPTARSGCSPSWWRRWSGSSDPAARARAAETVRELAGAVAAAARRAGAGRPARRRWVAEPAAYEPTARVGGSRATRPEQRA